VIGWSRGSSSQSSGKQISVFHISDIIGVGKSGSKKRDIMSLRVHNEVLQSLLALYNVTQAEITRYRDREWRNINLFVVSMVGILGFVLVRLDIAKNSRSLPAVFSMTLTIANVYCSSFTHWQLTKQRNVKKRIECLLGFDDIRIEGKLLHPSKIANIIGYPATIQPPDTKNPQQECSWNCNRVGQDSPEN